MILKTEISNFAGIRNMSVDFKQKNVVKNDEKWQFSQDKEVFYSQIPTLLAKNASGKTSFIKAIFFAMSFANEKRFFKNISHYVKAEIKKEFRRNFEYQMETGHPLEQMDFSRATKNTISQLFSQVSFAGSEITKIKLELTMGREILLEMNPEYMTISINKEKIDIVKILDTIFSKLNRLDFSDIATSSIVSRIILEETRNFQFISDANSYCLFRDMAPRTELKEINVKYKTKTRIENITKNLGFEVINILLKKMDDNIEQINYDQEKKKINIFIQGSDWAIAPNNLSFGTQKVIEIISKSLECFEHGGVVLIDEIENGLHLSLIKLITNIFENKEINKANAQLILTTHNPLIAEREIVNPKNIFLQEENNFVNIKDIKQEGKRTYSIFQNIKSKNYYNDLFWLEKQGEKKSTISNIAIAQIINKFEDGVPWAKK